VLQKIEKTICGIKAKNVTTKTVCFIKLFIGIVLAWFRAIMLEMLGAHLYLLSLSHFAEISLRQII
jgi:hypothetical protein